MSNSVGPDAVAPKRVTNSFTERTGRLERAITNPGAVKINVKGAFIVDEEPRSKSPASSTDGVHYESQDIRLPHHTGLVSHVAVDVSTSFFSRGSPQNHHPAISNEKIVEHAHTSK
jgi:type II pantothenate kinase